MTRAFSFDRRGCRLGLLAAVLLVTLWAFGQAVTGPAPGPANGEVSTGSGDAALYRDVAERVRAGAGYYSAAAALHRERNYPLRPFYAVRLPTLAWVASVLPSGALLAAGWMLLIGAVAAWNHRLRDHPASERIAALFLLTIGGAPLISATSVQMHEFWCGMLLTIALAFQGQRQRLWQLLFAALALAVREFAAAFLAVMLFTAFLERDRRGALALGAVAAAAVGLIWLHSEMVRSVVTPSDPASAGWLGLQGPLAVARDLAAFSWLTVLPLWSVAILAFVPILGWSALRREPLPALLWFGGFGVVVAALARPDNFYWVVVMLPAYLMGFAFVPRFFWELRRAK